MNGLANIGNVPEGGRIYDNGSLLYHLGQGVWVRTTERMADILDKL